MPESLESPFKRYWHGENLSKPKLLSKLTRPHGQTHGLTTTAGKALVQQPRRRLAES